MKKKLIDHSSCRRKKLDIILLKMKLLTALIFAGTMALSASSYSQKTKIDLRIQNSSVSEILNSIEKNSEFIFIYNANVLNTDMKKSISVKGENIEKVLDLLFKGADVNYRIDDRQIFLYKKEDMKRLEMINENNRLQLPVGQPQKKSIKGKVTDAKGEGIPGASVVIKGSTIGTITNMDGEFNLDTPLDAKILAVSFIGYKTQEIAIGNKSSFSVILEDISVGVDEVVVVGYGFQRKESVVGAITQVSNVSLVKSGNSTVTNAIAGKLSGVLTIQQTGQPGKDNSDITIRGLSSWNGSAPLVLVDGVERDFKSLDPNEIESISVLKDASSTAVFGARGANGVIIVTTRRGGESKPKLTLVSSVGLERAARLPKFIDSYTTMSMLNVAFMNQQNFANLIPQQALNEYKSPSTPLNALQYPNVDWYNLLTKDFAPTTNANINVRGGTKTVKYFASLGYLSQRDFFESYNQGGADTRYKYDRINYRTNLDFSVTSSTKLSINLGGNIGISNAPVNSNQFRGLFYASPATQPAFFPEWVLKEVPDPVYPDATGIRVAAPLKGHGQGNPYALMYNASFNENTGSQMFTDLILDQKLDFMIKGLSVKGKASLSTYYENNTKGASKAFPTYTLDYTLIGQAGANPWIRTGQGTEVYAETPINITVGGLNSNFYRDLYYEMSLNYKNAFGDHHVTGLALLNRQEKKSGIDFPYYNAGLVGSATYDFKYKYLFEVNIGYTGSERFAPKNRFGFFPSTAIGWVISEEKFFKSAFPWMNKLKMRYSDGIVGSDQASARWLYLSDYTTSGSYIKEGPGANVDAQWEEARKKNLGIEIGLLQNMFNVSVDLFDENRTKMLLAPQNVTMLVANSFKQLNQGSMKKHGIEIEVGFDKRTTSKIHYYINGNIGLSENRILFKDDLTYMPDHRKVAGTPLGSQSEGVELTGSGYYNSINEIHNNPTPIDVTKLVPGDYKFLDYDANGTITQLDKHYIEGSDTPPVTYAMTSGFDYKGFEFRFMLMGNYGKYINFNGAFQSEFLKGGYNVHQSALNYWQPNNPTPDHPTLHNGAGIDILNWGNYMGDPGYSSMIPGQFWRNANYLRLREVYISYQFDSGFLKRLAGISNLEVYLTGTNLLTFTKLLEGDPERKDFSYGYYPQMKGYKFGVTINF